MPAVTWVPRHHAGHQPGDLCSGRHRVRGHMSFAKVLCSGTVLISALGTAELLRVDRSRGGSR
jgi:hypothetical protein